MPDLLADVGRGMLVLAAMLAVAAVLLPVPRWVRVRRRGRLLQAKLAATEARVDASVALLRAQTAKTRELLRPWRTTLKWATHPLTVALARSYWRRWHSA